MTDTTPSYNELKPEDSWIDYLRTRLPYSFMQISEEKPRRNPKHFQLAEPVLLTGTEAAERHNFWKRGNVYYMTGKLMDYYSMSQVTRGYRHLVLQRRVREECLPMPGRRRGASRVSAWLVRCVLGCPPAIAAVHGVRTVPGAASLALPGTLGVG